MTGPNTRRRDPQTTQAGWELAVVVISCATLAVSGAALTGLGTASLLIGGGWVWPPHGAAGQTLAGLLTGHPGTGLPPRQASHLPDAPTVYGFVAAAELILFALGAGLGAAAARWRRPGGTGGGMATRSETRQALGLNRLRRAAPVIRPDLHVNDRWGKRR